MRLFFRVHLSEIVSGLKNKHFCEKTEDGRRLGKEINAERERVEE